MDLFISKLIGRSQLLIYKYIGGLDLRVPGDDIHRRRHLARDRPAEWVLGPDFLSVIPMLTFTFAIVYAMSTLVAVFTRSAIAAMIMSIGFMLVLYIVGQVKTIFDAIRAEGRATACPSGRSP